MQGHLPLTPSTISTTALLDLSDNDVVFKDTSDVSAIRDMVQRGFGPTHNWQGPGLSGITSSTPALTPGRTAIGLIAENNTHVDGQEFTFTSVLLKFAILGMSKKRGV